MRLRKFLILLLCLLSLTGCGGPHSSGDRVLVSKCAYDTGIQSPERYDVFVFKFPKEPMERNTPKNFIKRLMGLPGELIAIFFGRIYHIPPDRVPKGEDGKPLFDDSGRDRDPSEHWSLQYMHSNSEQAQKLFDAGEFQILRKPPQVMLALRRIVYDNDFQAKDLIAAKIPPRWQSADAGWKTSGTTFTHEADSAEAIQWLRYQHIVRPDPLVPANAKPRLITDTMGYNNYEYLSFDFQGVPSVTSASPNPHWVGDLMLEAEVEVLQPTGELTFELSKGVNRYRATWTLSTGSCKLTRLNRAGASEELATAATRVHSPGKYLLRLANVDARLTVWVDRELPFGDGKEYDPPEVRHKEHDQNLDDAALRTRRGPTENDLQPASVGAWRAPVTVRHLRLWRDTYYTTNTDLTRGDHGGHMTAEAWQDPAQWQPLQNQALRTMYVQPGHYLALGDNSPASYDGRDWGLVPERLILGRALLVYYPLHRAGPIR